MAAAGIIVYRNVDNHPQFLGLIALKRDRKRAGGYYDIPKGQIENREGILVAALRECFEESGLTPKVKGEPFISGKITVWLGEVDADDEVIIEKNPVTGYLEHEGYEWINPSKMKRNCLSYLRPHIVWAEKEIWKYF